MDLDNTIDGLLWVSAFRSLCKVRTGVDKTNETWPSGNTDCKDTIKDMSIFLKKGAKNSQLHEISRKLAHAQIAHAVTK